MSVFSSLVAFTVAAGLLTITPGVDTALVLRTAALEGPRAAWRAGLGVVMGCLAWGAAVAVGLGGLVAASEAGYTLLKWLGAGYLVWLGIGMIWKPRSALPDQQEDGLQSSPSRSSWSWLTRGLLTNLLNPKVGIFYVSFFPQFVPEGASVAQYSLLLAVIHGVLGIAWFALLIAASVPIARALRRPRMLVLMDRMTGCLFLAFGAKLALSRR